MKRRGFLFGLMAAPVVAPIAAAMPAPVERDAFALSNRLLSVPPSLLPGGVFTSIGERGPEIVLPVVRDWSEDPRFLRWIEELRHFGATDRDQEQLAPLLAASEAVPP